MATKKNVERTPYEDALRDWILLCIPSGWKVRFANSNGPRPRARYVELQVIVFGREHFEPATHRVLDESFETACRGHIHQQFTGTCQVDAFGKTAREVIEGIRTALFLPNVQEALSASSLAIRSSTDTVDVTELAGTRSVPRFTSDFGFGWAQTVDYAAEFIDEVIFQET